jgi:hypothetical protein
MLISDEYTYIGIYVFIEISEITTSGITMMTVVIIRRRAVKIEGVRNRDRMRTCGEVARETCSAVRSRGARALRRPFRLIYVGCGLGRLQIGRRRCTHEFISTIRRIHVYKYTIYAYT